ncbi:MAG: hypothetical protein R3C62_16035 [Chloroflexota bacterium]
MKILRRLIGIILLLGALLGIALSVGGVMYGRQAIDLAGQGIDNSLLLAGDSLVAVENTLLLAKSSVADVNTSMVTVQKTANDVANTVNDTRPLLQTVNTVATQDVPSSIEAVQEAVPNIVEVAGVVDTTLTSLSKFSNNQTIPVPIPSLGFGLMPVELEIPFSFDLGIDYKPAVPFDSAVEQVGSSLDGLPDRLRTLEKDLLVADANMALISADILNVSVDLGTINQRIAEISPLLDEYIRIVNQVKDALGDVRTQIAAQLDTAKLVILIIMIWIGLGNLAPLYLGLELVTGRRDPKDVSEAMADKLEALEDKIEAVEAEVEDNNA